MRDWDPEWEIVWIWGGWFGGRVGVFWDILTVCGRLIGLEVGEGLDGEVVGSPWRKVEWGRGSV